MATHNSRPSPIAGCLVAGIIGGSIPVVFGNAAMLLFTVKPPSLATLDPSSVGLAMVMGIIPSAIAAMIGTRVGTSGRAANYGAILFACLASYVLWADDWHVRLGASALWLVVVSAAVGALAGGGGAIIARVVASLGNDAAPFQYSLRELLIAVALVGVLVAGLSSL